VLPDTSPDVSSLSSILHFPGKACSAHELAESLNGQVEAYERSHAHTLHIERGMEIQVDDGITWAGRESLLVRLPRGINLFGSSRKDFHSRAVVYAVGFGSEKVIADGYEVDSSFWGYQSIEADLARFAGINAQVFIAGGGDGGLQETLRFAFLPDYHDLSIAVKALESAVGSDDRVWTDGLRDIMFAEDNAARAFMWGYRPELVFRELERVHERVIAELLDPSDVRRQKAVIGWRDHVTRQQRLHITLYDPKPIGRVYALNRFLCCLLRSMSVIAPGHVSCVAKSLFGCRIMQQTGQQEISQASGSVEWGPCHWAALVRPRWKMLDAIDDGTADTNVLEVPRLRDGYNRVETEPPLRSAERRKVPMVLGGIVEI